MKSYTCPPAVRARYQPFRSAFVDPSFSHNVPFAAGRDSKSLRPAANIVRKEATYEIKLAIPGLSKDKIRIEFIEDQLIISAINTNDTPEKSNFLRQEFDYAGFKRIFRLHRNANTSALNASFDQGILTIVIPDKEPESIKINIQ